MRKFSCPQLFKELGEWLSRHVPEREESMEGRQRFSVFLYSSILLFIGIPINLLGLSGPEDMVYFWMNTVNLTVGITVFVCYGKKILTLKTALSVLLVSTQLETSAEMLVCALAPSAYHMQLIVANLVLSVVLTMLAELAYLRSLPTALSLVSMGSYTLCLLVTDSPSLKNFYILFVIVFFATCLLGEKLIRNIQKLERENAELRYDEKELLDFLRLNKEQVKAYIGFSRTESPGVEDAERLLELLDERSQRNIIRTVTDYLREKQTSLDRIAGALPELSLSEREICRLILQGKKLGEICHLLGKTENNVTAHRGHIRKKLGLTPQENLKEALEKRMGVSLIFSSPS